MEQIATSRYQSLSKGLGTTGIILGIITLLFSFVPIFGMLAFLLGIVSLVICIIGILIAVKHQHSKSRLITALIITSIGTAISLMQFSAFG
ncbi:MAG: hypothetical protein AAGJ18_00950 [Bacteroidota bacterium]